MLPDVFHLFSHAAFIRLLDAYGYWVVGLFVAIESSGVPFPGEAVLVVAAVYAGRTHHLDIGFVIVAAAAGAIGGDNLGYLAGREGGFRLLRRYGRFIRVDEPRIRLGIWLFRKHGVVVVFLGRFVAVLRAWAAILAGTNRMPWPRFLAANAAGGVVWAAGVGFTTYAFGWEAAHLARRMSWIFLGLAAIGVAAGVLFVRKHEKRLEDEAARELPGSIEGLG